MEQYKTTPIASPNTDIAEFRPMRKDINILKCYNP